MLIRIVVEQRTEYNMVLQHETGKEIDPTRNNVGAYYMKESSDSQIKETEEKMKEEGLTKIFFHLKGLLVKRIEKTERTK